MTRQDKIEQLMGSFLHLKRSMNRQLVGSDHCTATPVQIGILLIISKGETRISDIATIIQASTSAVTQQVNQLVDGGFVKKTESEHDKREQILVLTIAGKHVIDMKLKLMRDRVEQLISDLTDEEIDKFVEISNKIADTKEY